MREIIGGLLLMIGILGIITLLGMAIYSAFGWVGVIALLSIISFICGMIILDGGEFPYED